eukprot:5755398-Pleurochrysis_carterae.AAC.1
MAVCRWTITAPALGTIMQTLCERGGLEWEAVYSYEQAAAAVYRASKALPHDAAIQVRLAMVHMAPASPAAGTPT